jgi:ferrochelatase
MKTAKDLASILDLPRDRWSVSFQSRLGPSKWIGPATDKMLHELPKLGKKHVQVACPSFVADCLETLEEISIEGKKEFLSAGGESYNQIPCMNADDAWVKSFRNLIREMNLANSAGAESRDRNSESRD